MDGTIKHITINGSISWYGGFYLDYDEKELQQAINKLKLGIDDKIKITISKSKELKIMNKAEKYIKDYTRNCSNIEYTQDVYAPSYHPWLTPDDAKCAVEIAKEEMLEEVCNYITDKMIQSGYTSQTTSKFINKLFDDMKQVIKNE